jgi:outer membrane receptor protein involved in Fe transport
MRFTWESPWDIDGSVNWRYLGGTKFTGNTTDPFYGNTPSIVDGKIPDVNYIDLTATYRWNSKLTVRAGANNVFDKDPPVISSGNSGTGLSNGNIYAGRYDCCGRQLFVGATVNF